MAFLSKFLRAETISAPTDDRTLLAIIDFSYQHYALGDLLTTQVNLATMAIEQDLAHVDIVVMANPELPSARYQPFITSANYIAHLDNIVPVFTCNPMLRSLQIIRDARAFNLIVLSRHLSGAPMWPTFKTHLRMRQEYPVAHGGLNAFHARHGYIPQLCAPRGLEPWARRFHQTELGGRPFAIINPRQSSLTSHPRATYRDAPLEHWYVFIDAVAARQPKFLFVMVGGYQEWEHRLLHRRNVFIPRACGLTLAHELALMKIAGLFMGTSSGFATFATFTAIPYAILYVEPEFAAHAGVIAGDRQYPFARANQILTWHRETTEELLALFEQISAESDDRATPSVEPEYADAPKVLRQ